MRRQVLTDCDLDAFYSSESTALWQKIIGEDLHYHFGYFTGSEDLGTGLKQTVRNYYAHIPLKSRVLDIGCGWGGPARLLQTEKQCVVSGVTISQAQAAYCQDTGLSVQQCDLEADVWPLQGQYDVILSLEMISHIRDKTQLLRHLRPHANRLILSESCVADDYTGSRATFGGSIWLCSVAELTTALHTAGWQIKWMRDRRFQSLRTIALWQARLQAVYGDAPPPGQFAALQGLVNQARINPLNWARSFPLIDVVAV